MFGYVLPDKPNLYMRDYALFRAYYCGLCHAMKKSAGQTARLSVNYDAAFINLFFADIRGEKPKIVQKRCILNPKKRAVADVSETSLEVARLNLILLGLKLKDDREDGETNLFGRILFSRNVRKARAKSPEIAAFADECFLRQREEEKAGGGLDAAAEPFSDMMKKTFGFLAGEKNSDSIERLGYLLGKYVYYMDALDDYDQDVKKKRFNAFYRTFGEKSASDLMKNRGEDVRFLMEEIIRAIEIAYREIKLSESEGIVTNVLWYGLRSRFDAISKKENGKCSKIRL